jgi:molybdopterin-containing oxidoreductase family membrane subunit
MLICWLKSAHPPREAVQKLSVIMTYAMIVNVFFVGMEFFTAFYSGIAHHAEPLRYMFAGMEGHSALTPWMWTSMILSILALVLLIRPRYRKDERLLAVACGMVFFSLWIDTGIGLIVAGFIPSPVGEITVYAPTVPEMLITLAIWAIGTLILTVLYKIALSVREEPLESSPAAIAAHL